MKTDARVAVTRYNVYKVLKINELLLSNKISCLLANFGVRRS